MTRRCSTFLRNQAGASAAEFALVLPLLLLAILGTIDVGRYIWSVNSAEKATQIGTRWAVATDMVASGLGSYSFSTNTPFITQGTTVPAASFPGIFCTGTASSASCQCKSGSASYCTGSSSAAFVAMVDRMRQIDPRIRYEDVRIDYDWSGLGFAGDPNGPDVAPLTTVTVSNLRFTPITTFVFGGNINLPVLSYTLTMEDGSGNVSN
jgi:Flp pilus assembly protein TadG